MLFEHGTGPQIVAWLLDRLPEIELDSMDVGPDKHGSTCIRFHGYPWANEQDVVVIAAGEALPHGRETFEQLFNAGWAPAFPPLVAA